MNRTITEVFFSPGGTAQAAGELFCEFADWSVSNKIDLLCDKELPTKRFHASETIVVTMPVFAGRIPFAAAKRIKAMGGDGTPAVAMVVYGNRAYEDALLELNDLLTAQGFRVVGAGAFVARHSIFPEVARNRPDAEDQAMMRSFAEQCVAKLERGDTAAVNVPGSVPYRQGAYALPIYPTGNSSCIHCGLCAEICPAHAIDANTPKKTDPEKCITCTACIYHCPVHARAFRGLKYKIANARFQKRCAAYQKSEIFV